MSEIDPDWQSLSGTWKSAPPTDAGRLRQMLTVRRRRMLAATAGEILIVLGFVLLSAFVARDGLERWQTAWLVTLWGFLAIAAVFAWWNRRGVWRPLGESVAEYIRLSRLRCERQRRTIAFVIVLFAAEAAAIIGQLAWFDRLTPLAVVLLALAGVPIAVWVVYTKRRIRREIEAIEAFSE